MMSNTKRNTAVSTRFCLLLMLAGCSLQPTQPGTQPTATPTVTPTIAPSTTPSGSPNPNASPSPIAPAGEVKLIQGARCEAGSLWVLRKDEEIAVAPCPPPESQPPYIQPATTRQIPEADYPSLKEEYGFLSVRPAPAYLGSLTPESELADGLKAQCNQADGVVFHGGRLGSCSQYLMHETGKETRLLKTGSEFRAAFAPIESAAEAASYAVAYSGDSWKSSFPELTDSFRYYNRLIRRSYTTPVEGGYEVLLYNFQQFGCGPHPYSAVTYLVKTDGNLSVVSRNLAWADPNQDNLCID